MIRLSIAIMHHPKREALLAPLVYSLGGAAVTVVPDLTSRGPWPTAKTAWASVRGGATHHLVLQDDVVVCRDFLDGAHAAITAVPDEAIGLYHQNKRADTIDEAKRRHHSWFVLGDGPSGPALILPVRDVYAFLDWEHRHVKPECPNDDLRIAMWQIAMGRQTWFTLPALVRQAPVPSIYRNRSKAVLEAWQGADFWETSARPLFFAKPEDPVIDMRYGGNYSLWLDEAGKAAVRAYQKQHGRFVSDLP